MKTNKKIDIDIVVPWVNGADPVLNKKREKYRSSYGGNQKGSARYRDWGIFKYFFRAIEENAPWVHKVYLVTDNQVPDFINTNCDKLVIVDHKEYIPEKFLPTFSSHTIEINFCNIKDLSEYFIYFNDDMYLNAPVKPSFFFKHNLPRYRFVEREFKLDNTNFMHNIVQNDIDLVNRHISRKNIIFKPWKYLSIKYGKHGIKNLKYIFNKKFNHFEDNHLPCPFLKSTLKEVCDLEKDTYEQTCSNKFRQTSDINQYVFKYYDLARGNFYPFGKEKSGYHSLSREGIDAAINCIVKGEVPLACFNDSDYVSDDDYEYLKDKLISAFEIRYPNKSKFER